MEFSGKQRKLIMYIIKDRKKEILDYKFNKLLGKILKNYYPKIGVSICKTNFNMIIKDEEIKDLNSFKSDIFNLISLLKELAKEKYIVFNKSKGAYNPTFEYNLNKGKTIKIDFFVSEDDLKFLLDIANSEFYTTPKLTKLCRKFLGLNIICDDNEFNFGVAIMSAIVPAVIAIYGIYTQYDIARNINTIVEFATPIEIEVKKKLDIFNEEKKYLKLNKFVGEESL